MQSLIYTFCSKLSSSFKNICGDLPVQGVTAQSHDLHVRHDISSSQWAKSAKIQSVGVYF